MKKKYFPTVCNETTKYGKKNLLLAALVMTAKSMSLQFRGLVEVNML